METNNLPLVSVIIPCYNSSKYIKECLDSIFEQDYNNIEVIIVDDGSSDDSVPIINEYKKDIKLIQQANGGPAKARNTALKASKGDYIAFIDADDIWLPNKLKQQILYMESHPEYGLTHTRFSRWNSDSTGNFPDPNNYVTNHPKLIRDSRTGWLYCDLLLVSLVCMITVVLRREVFEQVGYFDEDLRIGEDHDYWIRVSQSHKIACLNNVYSLYRINSDSITHKILPVNYAAKVLEKNIDQYGYSSCDGRSISKKRINQQFAFLWFEYAYRLYWAGKRKECLNASIQSLKYSPFNTKSLLYFFISSTTLSFNIIRKIKKNNN